MLQFFCNMIKLSVSRGGGGAVSQGYRLTFFRQEQAEPLKQNTKSLGASPKLRGPGFGGKLNSF